jgi:hypothetical protein
MNMLRTSVIGSEKIVDVSAFSMNEYWDLISFEQIVQYF